MIADIRSMPWLREAFIFACAILAFAFTGPFGTYDDLSFTNRLLYWSTAILGCGVFFWTIMYQTIYRPPLTGLPKFLRLLIGAALAAVPASAVVYLLQEELRNIPVPADRLPWLWFVVFFVGVGIGVVYFISPFGKFLLPQNQPNPASSPEETGIDNGETDITCSTIDRGFVDRIPNELGRNLISISMHDHYVEVTTDKGSAMIYLKFAAAVHELQDFPGMRIHRSHWISNKGAKSLQKTGRLLIITTIDGRSLPVSRTYRNKVLSKFDK